MNTISSPTKSQQALQAASDLYALREFIGRSQLTCLRELVRERSEEHEHFRAVLRGHLALIQSMPKTYESQEIEKPLVYLHYFIGACDWYIIEKDSDPDGAGQVQAFGWANLGNDQCAELGYISIQEILNCGAELDLYWTPKPLEKAIKK